MGSVMPKPFARDARLVDAVLDEPRRDRAARRRGEPLVHRRAAAVVGVPLDAHPLISG